VSDRLQRVTHQRLWLWVPGQVPDDTVIASGAKQSTPPVSGEMDCFAPLAMTEGAVVRSSLSECRPTDYFGFLKFTSRLKVN
jgi:hypothetical protein